MSRFQPDAKQVCVIVLAVALALLSLIVPLDGRPSAHQNGHIVASMN